MFERKNILVVILVLGIAMSGNRGMAEAKLVAPKRVHHCVDPALAGTLAGKKLAISTAHYVASTGSPFASGIQTMHKWINSIHGKSIDKDSAIRSFNLNYKIYFNSFSAAFHHKEQVNRACHLKQCSVNMARRKHHLKVLHSTMSAENKEIIKLRHEIRLKGINPNYRKQIIQQIKSLKAKIHQQEAETVKEDVQLKKCSKDLAEGERIEMELKQKEAMMLRDQVEGYKHKYRQYRKKVADLKYKLRQTTDMFKKNHLMMVVSRYEEYMKETMKSIQKFSKCYNTNMSEFRESRDVKAKAGITIGDTERDLEWERLKLKEAQQKKELIHWKKIIKEGEHKLDHQEKREVQLHGQLQCALEAIEHEKNVVKKRNLVRHYDLVKERLHRCKAHKLALKTKVIKETAQMKLTGVHLRKTTDLEVFKCRKRVDRSHQTYESNKNKLNHLVKEKMELSIKHNRCHKLSKRRAILKKMHKVDNHIKAQREKFLRCKHAVIKDDQLYTKTKRVDKCATRDAKRAIREVMIPTKHNLKNDVKMRLKKKAELIHKSNVARTDIRRTTVKIDKLKDHISREKELIVKQRLRRRIERYRKNIAGSIQHIHRIKRHLIYERKLIAEDRRELNTIKKRQNYIIKCQRARVAALKRQGALECSCGVSKIVLKRIKRDIQLFKKRKHILKKKKKQMRKEVRHIEKLRRKIRRTTDVVILKELKRKLHVEKKVLSKEKRIIKHQDHFMKKMAKQVRKQKTMIKKAKINQKRAKKMLKQQKKLLKKMLKKAKPFKAGRLTRKEAMKKVAKSIKKLAEAKKKTVKEKAKLAKEKKIITDLKAKLKTEKNFFKKQLLLKKIQHDIKKEKKLEKKVRRDEKKVKKDKLKIKKARKEAKKAAKLAIIRKERKRTLKAQKKIQKFNRKILIRKEKVLRFERKAEKIRVQLKFTTSKKTKRILMKKLKKANKMVNKTNKKIVKLAMIKKKKQQKANKRIKELIKKRSEIIKKNSSVFTKTKKALKVEKKKYFETKLKYKELEKKFKCTCTDKKAKEALKKQLISIKKTMKASKTLIKKESKKIKHLRRKMSGAKKFIHKQEKIKQNQIHKQITHNQRDIHFRMVRVKKDYKRLADAKYRLKFVKSSAERKYIKKTIKHIKHVIKFEKTIVKEKKKALKTHFKKFVKLEAKRRARIVKDFKKERKVAHVLKKKLIIIDTKRKELKHTLKHTTDAKTKKALKRKLIEMSREEKLIKHKVAKKTSKLITESNKYKMIEHKRQAEYKSHEVKFKLLSTQIQKERWNLSENQKMIHYWESKIEDLQNKTKCMGDDDVTIRNLIKVQTEEANRHILRLKGVRKVYNSKLSILREKISLDRKVMVDYKKYMVGKFKSEEKHFESLIKEEKLDITESFKTIEVIKKKLAIEKDPAERTREHRQIEALQIHIEHEKKEESEHETKFSHEKSMEKKEQHDLEVIESKEEEKTIPTQFIHKHHHIEFEEDLAHPHVVGKGTKAKGAKKLLLI